MNEENTSGELYPKNSRRSKKRFNKKIHHEKRTYWNEFQDSSFKHIGSYKNLKDEDIEVLSNNSMIVRNTGENYSYLSTTWVARYILSNVGKKWDDIYPKLKKKLKKLTLDHTVDLEWYIELKCNYEEDGTVRAASGWSSELRTGQAYLDKQGKIAIYNRPEKKERPSVKKDTYFYRCINQFWIELDGVLYKAVWQRIKHLRHNVRVEIVHRNSKIISAWIHPMPLESWGSICYNPDITLIPATMRENAILSNFIKEFNQNAKTRAK